jgi:DNA (cytosine-5)-methyltransferase 1
MGYHRAGFDVVGVDITAQPRYPFEFLREDALDILSDGTLLRTFDVVHASPPCQAYSDLVKRNPRPYPKLIEPVRDALVAANVEYVIENVEGATLRDPILLCGTMFAGLRVLRHRLFESRIPLRAPAHQRPHPLVFTYDRRKHHYGKLDQSDAYVQVTGGGNCTVANAREAMGIPWMTKLELNEAIPPIYTEFVGAQMLAHLTAGMTA